VNWELTANIAGVVVPTIGFFAWVVDQRVQLRIEQNNTTLLSRINGTYVKKEVLEEKLLRIEGEIPRRHKTGELQCEL